MFLTYRRASRPYKRLVFDDYNLHETKMKLSNTIPSGIHIEICFFHIDFIHHIFHTYDVKGYILLVEDYVISKTKQGPNFYIFSVLSPRICFCFVNPSFLAGSAVFFAILRLAVSKHDLKASGTFFRKFACDLGFAGTVFIGPLPPEGD